MTYIILAFLSVLLLLVVYLFTREKGITVLDSFFFFFLLQYGPHSLFLTRYSRMALLVPSSAEQRYLIGMTVSYLSLAAAIVVCALRRPPIRDSFSFPTASGTKNKSAMLAVLVSVGYIVFFAALQGRGLVITQEYIRGFSGSSFFKYEELRRELYVDTLYVRLASLTRQTTTAVLFAWLMSVLLPLRSMSFLIIGAAGGVFLICAMQMNKFPFVYFTVLTAICYSGWNSGSLRSSQGSRLGLIAGAGVVGIGLLYVLYRLQYRAVSVVTDGDLNTVLVYRIFFCASDTLRCWFDLFPFGHEYLGSSGISVLAEAMDLPYNNPTRMIPAVYAPGKETTAQSGFIGSGYAIAGYWGVCLSAFAVGVFVFTISRMQVRDRGNSLVSPFWNVLILNMLFFTTRELHTALLSGGTLSVFLMLLVFRRLPKISL